MQKVILARETSEAFEIFTGRPTCARSRYSCDCFSAESLLQARADGLAILLISEDLEELLLMSDYLYVICRGVLLAKCQKKKRRLRKLVCS